MQNQDMNLVLSSDAKPRLKWTPELHQRFIDALTQLGGADKATPKSLMRVMGVHGLTLYHLKSHLQKYRLGKSQQSQNSNDHIQRDYSENQASQFSVDYDDLAQNPMNESLQISQALQVQMEVQRKLHEQIEVQRHLQLRIEAQGKYLQSVLKKAQDTLAGYSSSTVKVEVAKAELSQLVSLVDNGCPSSCSLSALTPSGVPSLKDTEKQPLRRHGCSLESSLTSSESSGRKEETQPKQIIDEETEKWHRNSFVLPLMEMHPGEPSGSRNQDFGRKRSGSIVSNGNCAEQSSGKKLRKCGLVGTFDLNRQYMNDHQFDSGLNAKIDLNCKGVTEHYNGYL